MEETIRTLSFKDFLWQLERDIKIMQITKSASKINPITHNKVNSYIIIKGNHLFSNNVSRVFLFFLV